MTESSTPLKRTFLSPTASRTLKIFAFEKGQSGSNYGRSAFSSVMSSIGSRDRPYCTEVGRELVEETGHYVDHECNDYGTEQVREQSM